MLLHVEVLTFEEMSIHGYIFVHVSPSLLQTFLEIKEKHVFLITAIFGGGEGRNFFVGKGAGLILFQGLDRVSLISFFKGGEVGGHKPKLSRI